jgi:glycosyltransferase 2 family protein
MESILLYEGNDRGYLKTAMKKGNKTQKIIIRLLISAVILSLIVFGLRKDLSASIKHLFSLNIIYFGVGVLIYASVSFIGAFRLKMLLSVHNIIISYWSVLKNYYIGFLFNNLFLGSTGGDAVRSYYIAKQTHKKAEIVTLVFFDRFIGVITMMGIALASLAFNLDRPEFRKLAGFILIVLCLSCLFLLSVLNKKMLKKIPFLYSLTRKIPFKKTVIDIFETIHSFKNHKRRILLAIVLSVVIQSMAILTTYIISNAMASIDIALRYFFLFMPIIYAVSALPISIGGWGVGETAYIICFGLLGFPKHVSLSVALINRVMLILFGVFGAFVYMLPGTEHMASEVLEEKDKEPGSQK